MDKVTLNNNRKLGIPFICICLSYYMCAILATVFFKETIIVTLFNSTIKVSFALFPYVFLFPIGYIVLKVYGYPIISRLIISTLIMLFFFVVLCNIAINLPIANTSEILVDSLSYIFESSLKFYIAGSLIAVPAGAYTSLFAIRFLNRYISNDYGLYIISTLIGELINTILVFLLDFDNQYSFHYIIVNIISTAYLFKVIASIILSPLAVYGVKYLTQKAKEGVI